MKIDWQRVRQWLPGVLVSLLAVFFIFRVARWESLGPALAAIEWRDLLPVVGLFLASMLARVFAWWLLLQRRAPYSKTLLILNEGYLLNNLFPFRLGELGRAVFMGEASHTTPFLVLSTIMLERLIDVALAASLLLFSIPLVFEMAWARPLSIAALLAVLSGLLVLAGLARSRLRWRPWLDQKTNKWKRINQTILPWLDSLLDGFEVLNQPGQFAGALLAMLVSWGLAIWQYYLLLQAVVPDAQLWWAVFVLGVAAFGVAIPSAPASLGVFEAAIVGGLSLLGVDPTLALAYAVVAHLIHFGITNLIGLFGLFREGKSITRIYQRLVENRASSLVEPEST